MKELRVNKAQPTIKDEPVEDTRIIIEVEIPERECEEALLYFRAEARALHQALLQALPGGTYDHLFAVMVEERACLARGLTLPRPEIADVGLLIAACRELRRRLASWKGTHGFLFADAEAIGFADRVLSSHGGPGTPKPAPQEVAGRTETPAGSP